MSQDSVESYLPTYFFLRKDSDKITSGLRTLRLKFAQKDTICIRTHFACKMKIVLIL